MYLQLGSEAKSTMGVSGHFGQGINLWRFDFVAFPFGRRLLPRGGHSASRSEYPLSKFRGHEWDTKGARIGYGNDLKVKTIPLAGVWRGSVLCRRSTGMGPV
jgi:hypothetical protein